MKKRILTCCVIVAITFSAYSISSKSTKPDGAPEFSKIEKIFQSENDFDTLFANVTDYFNSNPFLKEVRIPDKKGESVSFSGLMTITGFNSRSVGWISRNCQLTFIIKVDVKDKKMRLIIDNCNGYFYDERYGWCGPNSGNDNKGDPIIYWDYDHFYPVYAAKTEEVIKAMETIAINKKDVW